MVTAAVVVVVVVGGWGALRQHINSQPEGLPGQCICCKVPLAVRAMNLLVDSLKKDQMLL